MANLRQLWTRILTGDGMRKSRFHTYSGSLINLAGLVHLPRALWSTFLLKAFGRRQRMPWLGYQAMNHLKRLLRPDWQVLEFGSGMSTLFFARLVDRVVSIESDPDWHGLVLRELERAGAGNVSSILLPFTSDDYVCPPNIPDHSFDFALVDGARRDDCARAAVRKVRPGGYVFLDNSDVPYSEHRAARDTLLDSGAPDTARTFVDFCPFQVQANESMIVRLR